MEAVRKAAVETDRVTMVRPLARYKLQPIARCVHGPNIRLRTVLDEVMESTQPRLTGPEIGRLWAVHGQARGSAQITAGQSVSTRPL